MMRKRSRIEIFGIATPNRRRKQRQAEDLLKPNVCIPIVGFLYAHVGARAARLCVRAPRLCGCQLVLARDAPLLFAVDSRRSSGHGLYTLLPKLPVNKIMSVQHNVHRECNKLCVIRM
ncbi:unnamed protein product [Danaus chrysippus]|uniref:(African queen) hypothetical protein n=1 Tax=Danaus chrysippus TaxID=151541 RepID=A0A8J2VTQ5_9NEOP|nr:unnamed protein product [Danaus chrysippus]